MKVTIKSWTAVAAWRWDVREDDDLCGICRVDFDATCPTCKFPGDDCPLSESREWIDQTYSLDIALSVACYRK